MKIIKDYIDQQMVMEMHGKMDVTNVDIFKKEALINDDKSVQRVVIDLKNLDYISSAGIRVFYSFSKKLRNSNIELTFVRGNDSLMNILDIAGFTGFFKFYSDIEEALK